MKLKDAIEGAEKWFNYLERQKQNTVTLQKAAALARQGDKEGALKLKSQVDNQPRVYDGANLEPSVRALIKIAKDFQTIIEAREKAAKGTWFVDNTGITVAPKASSPYGITVTNDNNGMFAVTAANITSKYIGGK